MKFLFIGDTSASSKLAAKIMQNNFSKVLIIHYKYGSQFPNQINSWKGDWIISYKSDLVLNKNIINKAKKGAVNIHPASPKYRGIGGYYYAIKNKDNKYGVTLHYIDKKIDHGKIIFVKYFFINKIDNHEILKEVTAQYCIVVLNELINYLQKNKILPCSNQAWSDHLHTRNELKKYCKDCGKNFLE